MYLNKTILFKAKGNGQPAVQGTVVAESSEYIVVISNGIQTSFKTDEIDIINILVDGKTETGDQTLINE